MRTHSNRRDAGRDTCPDCRATAARVANPLLPGRPPQVQHEPTCPTLRAAERQFTDDQVWLASHPDRPRRVRRITAHERDDMATALGRHVPADDVAAWRVLVGRRGDGLIRAYWRDGELVAVNVAAGSPAGAL